MMAPIMSRVWPVDGTVNRPSHRFACRNMAAMAVWVFPSPSGPIRIGNVAWHSVKASWVGVRKNCNCGRSAGSVAGSMIDS